MPNHNQASSLQIPQKWQPKFVIKRINEDDITITKSQRDVVVKALMAGTKRFVQIGEYTLMLNTIASIDPYWGPLNIPPRPRANKVLKEIKNNTAVVVVTNEDEIKLWDQLFGNKLLLGQGEINEEAI